MGAIILAMIQYYSYCTSWKEFSHWIVNNENVNGLELTVNSSHIKDGKVEITFKYKDKAENPKAIISKICSDGDGGLYNALQPLQGGYQSTWIFNY